jgi:hypothetical protein
VFARQLERQGVEAEATPRATRGVIKRGLGQALWHIRERGEMARVDQAKVREVMADFNNEQQGRGKPRPWEAKIRARQIRVRKTWLAGAKQLNESNDPRDRALANNIATFVSDMPPMKTERHEMQERIAVSWRARAQEREDKDQER